MSHPVADCHSDLLMAVRHLRERGREDPFGDFWLPQLRAGRVSLQVLAVCTESQFVGEAALRRSLLMIEEAHHLAALHSEDLGVVTTREELDDARGTGKIALLLAIEGAEPIGTSLEIIDTMWRSGIRMASLTWNRRTMMADGVGESDTGGRLTKFGVDAVRRMEDVGLIVDVSHLSEAGFFHLAEVARKPFIASHSSCRALVDHPRNLSDDQLRVIRDTGGFVAVNAFGPFVSEGAPSIDNFVDHLEHAISIVGEDRVGLGTDFIADVNKVVDPDLTGLLVDWDAIPMTKDFQRPADFPTLAVEAERRFGAAGAARVLERNLVDFISARLDPKPIGLH